MKKLLIFALWLLAQSAIGQSSKTLSDSSLFRDAFIYSSAENNYGADPIVRVTQTRRTLLMLVAAWKDSIGTSQIVDSAVFWEKPVNPGGADDTVRAYPVYRSDCWVEGTGTISSPAATGVTYTYMNATSTSWASAGCNSASDAGSYNCSGGYDRMATPCDSICSITDYTYRRIRIPGTYCQEMYTAGKPISIILIGNGALAATDFHSRQASSASLRPYAVIYYHAGETPPASSGSHVLIRK